MNLAVDWAFQEFHCHRVQAQIIDPNPAHRDIALGIFMALGFSQEGRAFRALFCPEKPENDHGHLDPDRGEWKDLITLALTDMNWVLRPARFSGHGAVATLKARWDDLFTRQEREREDMLLLEEREGIRKAKSPVQG